ncbi:hypothetical protein [Bosea sp. BIWAKO-01]|uniref:hypothetical protein n=1 Tax=Bosea sp. BIWAKO-01 TaxID=506668 RepID=UPI000853AF40|nr:hypothetical protein [Bosea sp. BIWAKO-01]GAU83002.1 hypothetical protein BIWAKO_02925 [Bosea sp. BIWAKO-01]
MKLDDHNSLGFRRQQCVSIRLALASVLRQQCLMIRTPFATLLCVTALTACSPTPVRQVIVPDTTPEKRIMRAGSDFVLPDGTRVTPDQSGGFQLPNGDYVRRDPRGALILPTGARCVPDPTGYVCP